MANRSPGSLLLLFLLLAAVIAVTGRAFLARQQTEARQVSHTTLTAIADLKAAQIAAWRNERLSDARFFSRAVLVAQDVATFLANPASLESRARTLDWLRRIQASERYQVVALFDAQLEERLTATPWPSPPGPELPALLAAARRTNDVWMTDFQQSGSGDAVHLDIFIPLFPPDAGTGRTNSLPGAVLLLRLDPRKFLYPLVQSWPTPSRSAETLLVRRDGDNVLFLNELRHQTNTALRLRRPLTQARLPAALAVRGELGLTEGLDYRGVPVVAAARAVPDTPWFMIAKMDEAELYAPLHRQARIVGAIVAALLLAATLGVGLLWRHSRTVSLNLELASQRQRLALAERVALLLRQANDIILLLDDAGRIVEANDRALQTYGYSETELRKMSLRDLRAPESGSDFDTRLHRAGASQGLIVEAVHQRKDASTFPVESSVREIEVAGRKHYQAIIRDITQRHAQLREITKLNRLYTTLSQVNQAIVRAQSRDEMLQAVCRAAIEHGQFRLAWIGLLEPETRAIRPAAQAGDAAGYVERLTIVADDSEQGRGLTGAAIREDRPCVCNDFLNDPRMQRWKPLIEAKGFHSASALPLHFGGTVCGALMLYADEPDFFNESELKLLEEVATDISYALDHQAQVEKERQAQEALRRNDQRFRALIERSHDAITLMAADGTILFDSPAITRTLGYSPTERLGRSGFEFVHPDARAEMAQSFARLVRQPRGVMEYQAQVLHQDGSPRWIEGVRTNLMDEPAVQAVVVNYRDITERKRVEEWLRQRVELQDQLAKIAAAVPGAIFSFQLRPDGSSCMPFASPGFEDLFDLKPEEVATDFSRAMARVHPGDVDRVKAAIAESARTLSPWHDEFRVLNPRKGELHVKGRSVPRQEPDGSVLWHGFVHDDTERRKNQEALRESEARFRALFEVSMDGVLLTIPDGRILAANPAACQMLGRTEPDICRAGREGIADPVDSRLPRLLEERKRTGRVRGELTLVRGDGSRFEAEMSSATFETEDGPRTGMMIRDITERKRAERALRESEELFRSLSASSPMGIFLADLQGLCVYANPRWRAILGLTLGAGVGDGWLRVVHPEDRTALTTQWSECVRQKREYSSEFRVRLPAEMERWVHLHSVIRHADSGEPTGLVGTLEDITDRKQAEDALRRSGEQLRALAERLEAVREEERIRLAREVHDQVGQALTSLNLDVAWLGERLDKLGLTTAHRALAGRLEAMSNRLAQTVSTVQRISSDLRPGILDDLGLAAAIEWQAEEFAARTGLTCEARCSPLSRDPAPKRSTALFRILQELLTNVVRHAQAGRVDLELREHAGTLILEVRDNGRGITEEQARAARSLGVLGVRERAQAVNGTVEFTGLPGQGTRVTVTVPLI